MSTILIVEDNAKNMKLVRDLLQHHGHRTLEADTGEGGLALVLRERPDLVLMDIQLPDIDGTTVLARIRGAKVTVMKGLGHFPMSENPEAFLAYLRPVLDEIRATTK